MNNRLYPRIFAPMFGYCSLQLICIVIHHLAGEILAQVEPSQDLVKILPFVYTMLVSSRGHQN